jgi:biotin carboxyl carrier protein
MKLMNSIHAGAAGCIAEICAVDGEMVAQHALLLRIQPDPP